MRRKIKPRASVLTLKEQIAQTNLVISHILEDISRDEVLQWLLKDSTETLERIDVEIEDEQNYAKYETNSYRSQKNQARKYVKVLRRVKRNQQKLIKLLTQVKTLRKLIHKDWS